MEEIASTSASDQQMSIESLRGIAGSLSQPMSWHEIEEIAQEEHAADVMIDKAASFDTLG